MRWIAAWLGARRAPLLVILVGIALAAPALTADFTADDHLHRVLSRDKPDVPGLKARPFDLFVFANGDAHATEKLVDLGLFPWWTDPALKLAFWRPLSSATHAADHALWPDSAFAQLAHNLAWHALSLVLVWLFFRRFLGIERRWIAVLALALYAFDDARGPVVGWIANRNSLVALCLSLVSIVVHDRYRRDGWKLGRWLGPFVFLLALGAGESAIAMLAYLAAHVVWLDRGSLRDRVVAVLPYLQVVIFWRILYVFLGYGVFGSGIYFDPGSDPVAFASSAASRVPFLLQGALALPWSDLASFYPIIGAAGTMLAVAWTTLVAIGLACARIVKRDPVARFFATGMVLSALPVASTFPADRLLGFIGLGAMGLVAQLIAAALRERELLGDRRLRRAAVIAVASVMVLVHVVLAPPLLVLRSRSMVAVGRVIDRADAGIPARANGKTVIIINTPSDALAGYIQVMRTSRHAEHPAHIYWLATATTPVTVERVDDRTLRVTPEHGLLRYEVDQMMRSPRTKPFAVGDRFALTNLEIEVAAVTADHRPSQLLVRSAIPLDDPALVWLRWEGTTYAPFSVPAVGTPVVLPAVEFLKLLEE